MRHRRRCSAKHWPAATDLGLLLGDAGGRAATTLAGKTEALIDRRRRWLLIALLVIVLFPVRQSALAPAEIVAMSASVVASPLDGVVKQIHVRPNQPVKAGAIVSRWMTRHSAIVLK